ncbi:peptidoglycan DD-metalloendopeptidase family protein [Xanthomonas albilineans]|uniref:Putative membrane-bound metalloendopeptidase protein n=1 Tax=Xanthomonas albilineans (strain GPE PC73 / CFBP 7063) TaxID=380358 RepID=D2UFX2_XANAP|nr:M23 family metallopeptidase [Xanthomonas albilineans]QHQ29536.1 putative membrane-bound metalloendopeptidase protein [Xanthomonas albilineans]CBA17283.1 putative membrane-bound metalloendopeptidase protein [Xanthomonas albilineans GPE PC73]
MAFKKIVIRSTATGGNTRSWRWQQFADHRSLAGLGVVLGVGMVLGLGVGAAIGWGGSAYLRAKLERQDRELAQVRHDAQTQVNALAARLGELQAQATRLNALGERLTRMGKLQDGEFDFEQPVGVGGGGDEPNHDIPAAQLGKELDGLQQRFSTSGQQLSVLESLLFDHQLDQNAVPSRMPIRNSYITSGFGVRVDPFGRGTSFHKGLDFHASVGDPVLAVADGVVSYAGVRAGYGNVVEIDHSNGYVTRYAHNSRLLVKLGDLVRVGQEIAKAGSTGLSTSAHVHLEVWKDGVVMNPAKFLGDGAPRVGRRGRG